MHTQRLTITTRLRLLLCSQVHEHYTQEWRLIVVHDEYDRIFLLLPLHHRVVCCPMSEKCDPLGNRVQIVFMVDIGHLGPNEHISQGFKKYSHRNPLFI